MEDRFSAKTTNPDTGFTKKEMKFIHIAREVMPPPVLKEFLTKDITLLRFIEEVIQDINYVPPLSNYDINNIPEFFDTIVILGVQFYSNLWLKQKWALQDLNVSDGGFQINFGRVEKLSTVEKSFLDLYTEKTKNVKRNQLHALVLGSPRMSSQLGNFVRMTLR
jgi:hypothetical protein